MGRPHFLQPLVQRDSRPCTLHVEGRADAIATTLRAAFDSTTRRRGLLDDTHLPERTALIIVPCSAVHTFGMKFDIDVIFAARDGRIVKVVRRLVPRRVSAAWRAFAAIELAGNSAAVVDLRPGLYLQIRETP